MRCTKEETHLHKHIEYSNEEKKFKKFPEVRL